MRTHTRILRTQLKRSLLAALLLATAGCGDRTIARAAAEPGAVKLPTGVVVRTLRPGSGPSPGPIDAVQVDFKGWLADGTQFDSTYELGYRLLSLQGVIPCWREGLQQMHVGEKAKLAIWPTAGRDDRPTFRAMRRCSSRSSCSRSATDAFARRRAARRVSFLSLRRAEEDRPSQSCRFRPGIR